MRGRSIANVYVCLSAWNFLHMLSGAIARFSCTSGFVDDVMFSHNRPYGTWRWQCRREGRSGHQVVVHFQRIRQVAPHCLNTTTDLTAVF